MELNGPDVKCRKDLIFLLILEKCSEPPIGGGLIIRKWWPIINHSAEVINYVGCDECGVKGKSIDTEPINDGTVHWSSYDVCHYVKSPYKKSHRVL